MLQTFTLKNGLKVATYAIPQMRSVYVDIEVKGGSLLEDEKKGGVAHFMEHLLVQGIPSFPTSESLSDYLEGLAGSYNAFTSIQNVGFYLSLPAKYLNEALRISSEVFFEPLFPDDSLERERSAILTEYHQSVDSLGYKLGKFMRESIYKPNHPFKRDILGTLESITVMSREDLKSYWSQFFHPDNTYLVVVGGFEAKEIRQKIEDWFEKYPQGKSRVDFGKSLEKLFSNRQVAIREDKKLSACYVDLIFPSAPGDLSGEVLLPQTMIRYILGGLRGSRLFRLLRQQRGLVYNVNFFASSYQNLGVAGVSCEVTKENLDETLELIVSEMDSFIKHGPTTDEMEIVKTYRVNKILMEFDHPSNIAGWIKDDLMWEDKIYLPEEWAEIVEKTTYTDVMEFMKKYWDLSKLNLVIQGPVENSKGNIKKYSDMIKGLI